MNNIEEKDFGDTQIEIDYTRDKNGVPKEFYGLDPKAKPAEYLCFLRILGFKADFDRKYSRVIVIKPLDAPVKARFFARKVKQANVLVDILKRTNSVNRYLALDNENVKVFRNAAVV